MKKITLFILLIMLCFSKLTEAQVHTTSSASASMMSSFQITKNSDIDFGTIAANGVEGTVILDADHTGVRTSSSKIHLPNETGNVTAAGFTVKGGDDAYTITLPTNDLLIYSGDENMVVNGFTSSVSKERSEGKEIIYLGATLHLGNHQAAGVYSNYGSGIEVTVNYN